MPVHIPFGHLSPNPCQHICVLLGGETEVRACGSAGTNHASINTSDVNKQLKFSGGECLYLCLQDYMRMCINMCYQVCRIVQSQQYSAFDVDFDVSALMQNDCIC